MSRLVLALDAGSTGLRAQLLDREGRVAGRAYRENRILYPGPGQVEQDLGSLTAALPDLVAKALEAAGAKGGDVDCVGLTGQRSTAVAWDARTNEPVANAIGWQDLRATDRAGELAAEGHFVPAQAAAVKLEWITRNVAAADEARQAGALRLGTLESFLLARLSGGAVHATDVSHASASGLYDFFEHSWNAPLAGTLGFRDGELPAIRASSEVLGETTADLLGQPVPVSGLAGDQQAAMFGQLRLEPGMIKASYGTSTMIDLNVGRELAMSANGALPMVLWRIGYETLYLLEGMMITGGAAIRWLRDGLGILKSVGESEELAESVGDAGGVWAVPALQGMGTPYLDAGARAAVGGMSLATTKGHVVRAVLEGIALRCVEVVRALEADSPSGSIDLLRVDGGAAANDFLLQLQADLLGIPVERPEVVEAAATGAAFLAGLASGFWPDVDSLRKVWRLGARFEPRMARDEREARLDAFRKRVEAIRQIR